MSTASQSVAQASEPEKGMKSEINVAASSVNSTEEEPAPRTAGRLDVLVQGVALFSDGYNIQIIGYMNTVLAKL